MTDRTDIDYFERRKGALKTERASFISHYKDLSEFIVPRRGRFDVFDRNIGTKRHKEIINSKGTQAYRVARAGLLAGIMSPTRPWFSLGTPDPDMMEFQPVKIWLNQVELILRAIFNGGNLYNMAPAMLGDTLLFGTGCMTQVDDFDDVARFYTHTAGSYMIGQDQKQRVNTIIREFMMTAEQMIKEFGKENVSIGVEEAYDKGNYDSWHQVTHVIEPNPNFVNGKIGPDFMKFRSIKYEPGNVNHDKGKFLNKSGFNEFPAYVPRWERTGEDIYGTDCPGMTSLGDVKQLQLEEKRKAQAIDKMVNPPLKGPASLESVPVSSLPGGLTIYDTGSGQDKLEPIYTVNPQLGELRADMQGVENRIDAAFFADMFLAISNMDGIQPRNELELSQRNQERLLQLGPVLENLHGEFLDPLIDRTFAQAIRADILPEPPEELQGAPLRVDYISTLAMAQRSVATAGIDRMAGFIVGLAGQGYENVLDKFDADQAADEYSRLIGVTPRVVRPDDQVAEIRAERQQQIQQQQQMQMAQQAASIAKTTADTKTGEDTNALTDMRDAASGQ